MRRITLKSDSSVWINCFWMERDGGWESVLRGLPEQGTNEVSFATEEEIQPRLLGGDGDNRWGVAPRRE